jgi:anti-sigma regulatory factor (Ser/Thr protein kinase)
VETHPIDKGDGFMVWTDGLEDLAEHFGVTSLTMAYRLRCDQDQGRSSQVLDQAGDDVLLAAIESPSAENWRDRFQPLIVVRYGGDEAARIDEIQETWRHHLEFAVLGMPETPLWDLLLACREALLNALNHGCDGRADRQANFQVSHCPGTRTVRVWMEDPGPGHDFDFAAHADIATEQMEAAHRGLILIHCLARSVTTERNGATLIMDFDA